VWLRATVPLFFVFFSHFAARPTPPYRTGGGRSVSPGGPLGHWHGRQRRVRTVRTQYYLSTPIRGQCARLPRPASHKPHLLLPHDKGAFVGEEDQHPVVGPRPTVPRPRGMCPCWQTRRPFLAGERDDNPRPLTAFCIVWKRQVGGRGPSSSVGALGIVLHYFLPDWRRGCPAPSDGARAARIHSPPLSCSCLHCQPARHNPEWRQRRKHPFFDCG